MTRLGQPVRTTPTSTPIASAMGPRTIVLAREEAQLLVAVADSIITFSKENPIEYLGYCPETRWAKALELAGTWYGEMKKQLDAGAQTLAVPVGAVMAIVDLDKCSTAARDARLYNVRWALGISAAGVAANLVFGLSWVTVPTYMAGLGVLFAGPIIARYRAVPQEPYKPTLSGRKICRRHGLGNEDASPTVLERVIVGPGPGMEEHHWGHVHVNPGGRERSTCLRKGRFRVRVEGWEGDQVDVFEDWEIVHPEDCDGRVAFAVWDPKRPPEATRFGPVPAAPPDEKAYFVEYVGPGTGGRVRRAGPFGCTRDPELHAKDDGGPGTNYVILDREDREVSANA